MFKRPSLLVGTRHICTTKKYMQSWFRASIPAPWTMASLRAAALLEHQYLLHDAWHRIWMNTSMKGTSLHVQIYIPSRSVCHQPEGCLDSYTYELTCANTAQLQASIQTLSKRAANSRNLPSAQHSILPLSLAHLLVPSQAIAY